MFVNIPAALNENAEDEKLVAATLAAGLYPKILTTNNDTGGLKTLTGGQAISIVSWYLTSGITISADLTVLQHPSSVNFRMKMSEFEANHIVYFTIMQSKKASFGSLYTGRTERDLTCSFSSTPGKLALWKTWLSFCFAESIWKSRSVTRLP